MEAYFQRPPCKVCKTFAARRGEEPECETCLPDVFEENAEAVTVFPYVHDQMIIAPSGKPIGINLLAVFKVMEMLQVEDQQQCLNKVRFLFDEIILRKI
jgi:hypothetical protein